MKVAKQQMHDRLVRGNTESEDDSEQLRNRETSSKCFGAIAGGNAHRAENARNILRKRLRKQCGR